jgi:glycine/D-amino acid oxidase-like deaminating enzyme
MESGDSADGCGWHSSEVSQSQLIQAVGTRHVVSGQGSGGEMLAEADAVVIGAGAFGISAAFHLAHADLKRVVLVDRFAPASQSSPRAAGLFKQIQADETRTRLAALSIKKIVNFEADTGLPSPVVRSGSLMVARTPQHAEFVRREAEHSRSWGADVELVDAPNVHRLMPAVESSGILAACHSPGDIYIEEPITLLNAYLEAGMRLGLRVLSHTNVIHIVVKAGEVDGVVTDKGVIQTPLVVDAAGGWARAVGELGGVRVPVVPVRHQLYITKPISGVDPIYPIVRFIDSAVYIRPARGGLMLGGFEATPMPFDPRDQVASFSIDDVPLDMAVLKGFVTTIERNIPSLGNAPIDEHRGGLFTMTSDGRFIVGPAPEVRGFWVATGCNGSGFSFAPALGQMLAEWIVGGDPSIDLTSLAPARFAPSNLDEDQLRSACLWQYAHYYDPAV